VLPGAHIGHHILADLALGQQQREDLLFPELEERLGSQLGQGQKCAVGQENPLGHQRMDVRMPVDQLPERLDRTHHAGHGVGPTAGGAVDGDHRARRRAAQLAQQAAVEPEVDPQPLRDREYKLPVRHLGADVLADPTGLLPRPLLVARRAETTPPA
jgi:hypothetical protein